MSVHTGLLHAFLQDGDDFQHLGFARLPFASRNADFPFSLPAVRSAAVAFWAVWESLKIVDHQALRRTAKPMRLPLDDTLRAAHAAWKSAPSTFRIAKRGDVIAAPLAGWKSKKYVFLKQAGSERLRYELYIGANDEWLCWACSKERARVQHPHGGSDPTVTALLELCCSVACHDRCVRCAVVRVQRLTRRRTAACGQRPAAAGRASRCSRKSGACARSAAWTARTSKAGCCWAAKARSFRWRTGAGFCCKSSLATRSTRR
jgi:hypothetical protein